MTDKEVAPPEDKKYAGPDAPSSPPRRLYRVAMVLTASIAVAILAYIALETIQQADRTIESAADKYAESSKNNLVFKNILDDLRSGKNVGDCIKRLEPIKDDINARRMILGLETFDRLSKYVAETDDINYEDLRETIQSFLNETRSNYNINPDTLYFAFLARDIMLYIFSHNDVFLIHDSDTSIIGKDGRSLKAYYTDALTIYNLLKRIHRDKLKSLEGFFKDADNSNLFIVAMYCKARKATNGIDDKTSMNEVMEALTTNQFAIAGQQAHWLKWLDNDIQAVDKDLLRIQVKSNRPSFVSTTWLR